MLVTCYHALEDEAAERKAAENTLSEAERVLGLDPGNGAALAFGARAFAVLDQVEHAREWMDRALLIDAENLSMRFSLACMLAAQLGDHDRAMMLLQRNFSYMSRYQLSVAARHPDLQALREDGRFINMVARARKRVGLPDDGSTPVAAGARQPSHPNWFKQRPLT
jgi:adenylate cyclase